MQNKLLCLIISATIAIMLLVTIAQTAYIVFILEKYDAVATRMLELKEKDSINLQYISRYFEKANQVCIDITDELTNEINEQN